MKHVSCGTSSWFLTGVLLLPVLMACSPQDNTDVDAAGRQSANVPVSVPLLTAPVMDELASLDYSGVYDEPVTLADGRWEGEPVVAGGASRPLVGLVEDFYLDGDLNGDGAEEAVVILWETAGGSGVNSFLVAVGRHEGRPVNIGTALIGDRVQLRAGRIEDGHIELDVVQQGPNDAACCPAETVTRVWATEGDGLKEGTELNRGRLSLAYIERQEWQLAGFGRDEAVPYWLEIDLFVTQGRITGQSACNRYFGSVTAGDNPGDMTLGKLGSTHMACPPTAMEMESRYLQALSNVTRFDFLNGRLALTWRQDGNVDVLLFTPRDQ